MARVLTELLHRRGWHGCSTAGPRRSTRQGTASRWWRARRRTSRSSDSWPRPLAPRARGVPHGSLLVRAGATFSVLRHLSQCARHQPFPDGALSARMSASCSSVQPLIDLLPHGSIVSITANLRATCGQPTHSSGGGKIGETGSAPSPSERCISTARRRIASFLLSSSTHARSEVSFAAWSASNVMRPACASRR